MNYKVKKHSNEEFYDEFCRLLDLHKFPRINNQVLPEIAFAVYNEDNVILYSFWFYFTTSKLAWIAFPVSNKNVLFQKREGALGFLLEHISNYAKRNGIITLFTTSSTEGVINPLLKNGFDVGDTDVNHYIKPL